MLSYNIITPCYKEKVDTIIKNIQSVKNHSELHDSKHLLIFDGVNRFSELSRFNQTK